MSNGDYEDTAARKTRSDGSDKKITPEFVGKSLRINTGVYIKCLQEVLVTWVKRVAAGRLRLSHMQDNPVMVARQFLRPHHPLNLAT